MAVGANVFGINEIAKVEIRQLLCLRDSVECIAGRAEDGGDMLCPLPERLQVILAVVEQYPRKGVINAVIQVIAALPVALGFADDFRHKRRCRSHHEPARFRQNFQIFGE